MNESKQNTGSILLEVAFIIMILGVMMVHMLEPMAINIKMRMHTQTQDNIQEALTAAMGFLTVKKRLPCPDTDGDGLENCTAPPGILTGTCPYADLGVSCLDGWKRPITWEVDARFTVVGGITLASMGAIEVEPETAPGEGNQVYAPLRISGQGHEMTVTRRLPYNVINRRMVYLGVLKP
jgi:hypothetical protein